MNRINGHRGKKASLGSNPCLPGRDPAAGAWSSRTRGHGSAVRAVCSLVVMSLLLALVTGCGSSASQSSSSKDATPTPLPTPIVPETPTYTVQVGTVVETLEFTGRASAELEQELFFETGGDVSEVFFGRGDEVKAGDILAELDIDELERQLSQQIITLQTAELNLEQTKIELTEAITTAQTSLLKAQENVQTTRTTWASDLEEAKASVTSAETSLANAKLSLTITQNSDTVAKDVRDREYEANFYEVSYGEYLKKYNEGQISKDRLDLEYNNLLEAKENLEEARAQAQLTLSQAESQVTQAEESLRQAKAKVVELQAGTDVSDAEDAVQDADKELAQAIEDADPESLKMKLLELTVDQAELDLQDLKDEIAASQLIAPFDGQILSLEIEAGDSVEAYTAIGVLADPSKLEITAELSSDELSQMALNQEAVITLRNRPGESFNGTVRQLPYPYGGTLVDTGDDDTAVHVSVEGDVAMELGELATVSIVLQEKENVLWLPPAAIRTYQGRDFVVIQLADGSQKRVDVLLGITTEERVEITTGLEEGQLVVGE